MKGKKLILSMFLLTLLTGCFGQADPLATFQINPDSVTVEIGKKQEFALIATDSKGNPLKVTATWSLSNEKAELINNQGTAVELLPTAVGAITLTARAEGQIAISQITISPEPAKLTQLVITPEILRLGTGEKAELQVSGLDQYGNSIAIAPTWSVTNGLGSFSYDNSSTRVTFTGDFAGAGLITATVGTLTAELPVTVETPVQITDTKLKSILLKKIGKTTEPVFPYELKEITSLLIAKQGIRDLTGLEACTNLVELNLNGNDLVDLQPIADLEQLTTLKVTGNYFLTSFEPLQNLTKLKTLEAAETGILDLSPIANLTQLSVLNLQNAGVNTIDFLTDLTQLEQLYLGGNFISEISSLARLSQLKILSLDGNRISDISVLNQLPLLEHLGLTQTNVPLAMVWALPASTKSQLTGLTIGRLGLTDAELTHLSEFAKLERLDISGIHAPLGDLPTGLTNLGPLANLPNLKILLAHDHAIRDLSGLVGLEQLGTLQLQNNQISDLSPLVNNAGIAAGDYLSIWGNALENLQAQQDIATLKTRGVFVYDMESTSLHSLVGELHTLGDQPLFDLDQYLIDPAIKR